MAKLSHKFSTPYKVNTLDIIQAQKDKHLTSIINFQIHMAEESEGLILDRDILSKGVEAVFDDPSKGFYLIAEEKGKPVANLLVVNEWSDWRNGKVWWIHSVYVLPDYRGKGIFRQMYEYLKENVQQDPDLRGIRLYVDKSNINAQKVYKAIGMSDEHYYLYEWLK